MSVLGIQPRPVVPDGRFLGPASGLSGHGVILTLGRRQRSADRDAVLGGTARDFYQLGEAE
jgi:hypothetical protein